MGKKIRIFFEFNFLWISRIIVIIIKEWWFNFVINKEMVIRFRKIL